MSDRVEHGWRPRRSVVDFTGSDVGTVNSGVEAESRDLVSRLGFDDLLSTLSPRRPTRLAA